MDHMAQQNKNEKKKLFVTHSYSATVWHFVLISLLLHILAFIILKNAKIINLYVQQNLPAYEVELLRPPIDNKDLKDLITEYDRIDTLSNTADNADNIEQSTEDTISLDTTDPRYEAYAKTIKQAIMSTWIYPEEAKKKRIEGALIITFSINANGDLLATKIDVSSEFFILNEAAWAAIRMAAPFPPFPPSVTVPKLNVKAGFTYRLSKK